MLLTFSTLVRQARPSHGEKIPWRRRGPRVSMRRSLVLSRRVPEWLCMVVAGKGLMASFGLEALTSGVEDGRLW